MATWTALVDRKNLASRHGHPMALVSTGEGRQAIDCTGSAATYSADRLNANLISAAPELLAALEGLLSRDRMEPEDAEFVDAARAAIKKAKGRK